MELLDVVKPEFGKRSDSGLDVDRSVAGVGVCRDVESKCSDSGVIDSGVADLGSSGLIATGIADSGAYGDVDGKHSHSGLIGSTYVGVAAGFVYDVSPAKVLFAEDVDGRERGKLSRVTIVDRKRYK